MTAGAAAQQPPRSAAGGDERATSTRAATAGGGATGATGATSDRRTTGAAGRPTVDRSQLDRDAAERVLRRAVQLDGVDDVDQRVSVQALLDAADELGIDRAEVRRAVVEEELGLLERRPRRADALLGPERFVVARVVEGSVDGLTDCVDQWMRKGRVLRRARSTPAGEGTSGWVEYARRNDPVAGAQRAVHAVQGGERLAHVRKVRVVVTALDDRRCVVGLLVDATRSRQNAAAGGTAVTVTGVAASAVGLLPPWGWGAAVGGAVASAAAGAGVMWSRKAYTSQIDDELESVLDAVASGERPPSVIEGVTSRLLRPSRP
ncbi:hypothetical protein [Dermatobacter hominis]|uniref:hypothetical protein n=1 Tax=Dermatobacter hominis TaxID=2884263 RepID=UPI001D0FA3A3|nr:hypothetical protein [Dermatobacter hominis]UDY33992.1 hypothetical protein LH044_11610 [Dermatobacter hominis]